MPTVKPVTPAEFGAKVSNALIVLFNTLNSIIVPLTIVAMGVSVLFLIIGFFTNSMNLKKIGLNGIVGSIGGFIIFKAIPLILGLWITVSKSF